MKPLIERITQGPVRVHPQLITVVDQQKAHVADCDGTHEIDDETRKANAEFIAEAFTVAHETGMTPRQMAERIAELEAGVNGLLAETGWHHIGIDTLEEAKRLVGAPDNEKMHSPELTLPPGLPPLPPGTRYAGQLKDHEGAVEAHIWYPGRRVGRNLKWSELGIRAGRNGMAYGQAADWHLAVPI